MFGIGMPELLVILVIILIIFGAGRLPEIGSAVGKGIKNFKKSFQEQEAVEKDTEKIQDKK
jgi:sec-independent protein translocase protein TatA